MQPHSHCRAPMVHGLSILSDCKAWWTLHFWTPCSCCHPVVSWSHLTNFWCAEVEVTSANHRCERWATIQSCVHCSPSRNWPVPIQSYACWAGSSNYWRSLHSRHFSVWGPSGSTFSCRGWSQRCLSIEWGNFRFLKWWLTSDFQPIQSDVWRSWRLEIYYAGGQWAQWANAGSSKPR
jgi:hypothetical protein